MEPERSSQSYPTHEPLQLHCETWREFVDNYANDICRGGMFIRTDHAPEPLSEVELRLSLPEGTAISLSARVVHVVTPEQAEQYHHVAGMGVEFIHTDAEQKRQILQLVEFARSQGDEADPNSSWTRTLLENSAPLATRDVAARLSMMPDVGGADTSKSRVNMTAVQVGTPANDGSSPTHVAVRPRSQSVKIDSRAMAAVRALSRPTTQPISRSGRAEPGPVTGTTSRSSVSNPAVRAPTGPVAPPSGAQPSQPSLRGQPSAEPGPVSGPVPSQNGQPQTPPKPTDLNRLKLVLNGLAHKQYEDAARLARDMLADNPGDPQVLKWQAICFARIAITCNDPGRAREHYAKALSYDENNREAREFVRDFQREQKLNSLPFGRYFTKKKLALR
jgi:uncharacterized protein (TIGR02266 family)